MKATFRFVFVIISAAAVLGQNMAPAPASPGSSSRLSPAYQLQTGDEITVRSLTAKEIADKAFRIDDSGEINFPLIGRVHLSGLSPAQAETVIAEKLQKYYINPDVQVTVSAPRAEEISVLGSVGAPGVHQLRGETRLLDALSLAGGVRPDAGPEVIVTRQAADGGIDYAGAAKDASGGTVARINLKNLLESRDPKENIRIQPHDVISLPQEQMVYVVGNVKRSGGFPLSGRPDLSVLQALALAEGLDPRAAPQKARILRRDTQPERQIPVDVKKILAGKAEDLDLHANDILFVPSSTAKVITNRSIEAAIQVGTGLLIWR